MPWKVREDGLIEVENGNPVYVHPDGKEVPFDAAAAMKKIGELASEAKSNKLKARELAEKLEAYSAISDIDEAIKAMQTVKNLEDKKLVDANQIDMLKAEMAKTFLEKESSLKTQWSQKEQEYQKALQSKEESIYSLMVNGKFASSPFITEKTVLPPDVAATFFGKHFKVEGEGPDVKIVGYLNGERIPSREKFGEAADFEEALTAIVDAYPHKDRILKTGMSGGSASQGNRQQAGQTAKQFIPSGDPKAFGDNLERIAKGEVQVAR